MKMLVWLLLLTFTVLMQGCATAPPSPPASNPVAPPAPAAPAPAPAPVYLPAPVPPAPLMPPVASPVKQEVTVYFVTDRAATADGRGFGGKRANGEVSRGKVTVHMPEDRGRGDVPRPGWFSKMFGSDRDEYMYIRGLHKMNAEDFYKSMRKDASDDGSIFLFVHGYNNTFEDASLRTAQIAYDLGMPSLPALFSWSSAGKELAYFQDSESARLARPAFVSFVNDLISKTDAKKIYVLGHSMGTRIVSEGIAEVVEKRPEWTGRIKEVLLAAADINAESFREEIAPRLVAAKLNVTIYASGNDKTLMMSKKAQGYARVGDVENGWPVRVKGVETIDASKVPTDWLSHSYIASSNALLTDMETLFRKGARASERAPLRMSPKSTSESMFWVFP